MLLQTKAPSKGAHWPERECERERERERERENAQASPAEGVLVQRGEGAPGPEVHEPVVARLPQSAPKPTQQQGQARMDERSEVTSRIADDGRKGGAEHSRYDAARSGRDLLALVLVEPVLCEEGRRFIEAVSGGPNIMSENLSSQT